MRHQQGGKVVAVGSLPEEVKVLFEEANLTPDGRVYQCKSITANGFRYCQDSVVIWGCENDMPQFDCITNAFIIGGMVYLLCAKKITLHYDRHCHAYVIRPSGCHHLLRLSDAIDGYLLPLCKRKRTNIVILHHHVCIN